MKKLLTLLLALVLCLGAFVACDTPEESSASTRPSGDETVNFYYHKYKKTTDNFSKNTIKIAENYSEYLEFASTHSIAAEIPEDHFEDVYILLARTTFSDDLTFMGYYNLGEDENGYWINVGFRDDCSLETYNEDDKTVDHILVDRVPLSSSSSASSDVFTIYSVVIIFKSEIDFAIDPSKPLDIYKNTFHFVG